jgi:SNF family Na+-dependent transporter
MAGNAVGLGNFLRFPVQAAQNGGGAFMIPYFISFLLLGIPLMWVEWTIGRYGGRFGHSSLPGMFDKMWNHPVAKYLGVLGLFMPLAVMVYYTYVESWSLGYSLFTATGRYWGNDTFASMSSFLAGYQGWGGADNIFFSGISWAWVMFAITLSINVYVLSKGISGGIEIVARYALPALFVLAGILVVRVLMLGTPDPAQPDFSVATGMGFIWNPQLDQLADPGIWLAAAGQIFFTLSLGMGTIHCYASYLAESDDIALTGLATASTNEFAEVVLGGTLAIPAAVAFFGLDATRELAQNSYDLAFAVMPALFQKFPFGQLFGTLWFGLLFIAGITSSLAQGQPLLSFLQEEFNYTRKQAAMMLGLIVFILCQPVIFFIQHGYLNELDYWAGTFGLVILATVEIILFAWLFGMKKGWDEITRGADIRVPLIFRFIITWVTPLLLLVILGRWAILELPSQLMMEGVADADKPYILGARIVMVAGFLVLCLLVRQAWRRRARAESEVGE